MKGIWAWLVAHYQVLHDFAGPVATFLAACTAVFITWRIGKNQIRIAQQQADTAALQAKLADVRLQHDLYDRRYKLYETAKSFSIPIVRDAKIDPHSIPKFNRD